MSLFPKPLLNLWTPSLEVITHETLEVGHQPFNSYPKKLRISLVSILKTLYFSLPYVKVCQKYLPKNVSL